MSAIVGIYHIDGHSASLEQITKMNDTLSHRGPDGSEVWLDGPVAFGHQMLYTTPESLKEKLPFQNSSSGLVITSDARIDNRAELAPLLGLKDVDDVPDSTFILESYLKWGEECPKKLLGDFAFAIWDPNGKKLFCARDHMGVKPFYYYISKNCFIFATEIKAILAMLNNPAPFNEQYIVDYISSIFEDKKMTFYENIFRLPAAHCIKLDPTISLEKYWSLNPKFELTLNSDEEYITKFKEIFFEAIRCRLRSVYPLGFNLSGGLDSSSVLFSAQKILQEEAIDMNNYPLRTFSVFFEDVPQSDESPLIKKIVSKHDIENVHVKGDKIRLLEKINDFFGTIDQPYVPPNMSIDWEMNKKIHDKGCRIRLDGIDGDTAVSHGKFYLKELASQREWIKLITEVNKLSIRKNYSFYQSLMLFLSVITPQKIKSLIRIFRWHMLHLDPKFGLSIDNFGSRKGLRKKSRDNYFRSLDVKTARERHYNNLNSSVIQYQLEYMDSLDSAFSIESRHPFYDKRLIEFCLSLPADKKMNQGWDRFILRKSMNNILPSEYQWRKNKIGWGDNFDRSLSYEKTTLKDVICNNHQNIKKYVDIQNLQRFYSSFISGKTVYSYGLWQAITLSLWIKYIKNKKN